jgi:8-amino-7-oxononanoate synthase
MSAHDAWLADVAQARRRAGLWRVLTAREATARVLDLAGNDYLGLARDPRVVAGAVEAVRTWGAGATGSRLVCGTTTLHAQLESELADFGGADAALVVSTGYAANLAVLQALTDDDTLVVSDAGNHASLIDGCRLSRGEVRIVRHLDVDAVAELLAARTQRRAVVVTDSVFSVDGDMAPLVDLHVACRRHGAVLVIDEAHGFGVLGDGAGAAMLCGIAGEPDVVRTVTLSKALGSQGGAILAGRPFIEHLVNTARTFIFDTGLAPACVGAARSALCVLRSSPELPAMARRRAADLAAALGAPPPDAAVVSVVVGDPHLAVAAARGCLAGGVAVGCFRPPSVPAGTSRLRVTARADLTDDDVETGAAVILAAVKAAG